MEFLIALGACALIALIESIGSTINSWKTYNEEIQEAKQVLKTKNELKIKEEHLLNFQNDLNIKEQELFKDVDIKKEQILNDTYKKKQEVEANLNIQQQKLSKIQEDINYIMKDSSQACPWLAERYADYFEIIDTKIEEYLLHKKNPAIKASEAISIIKQEKRELLKQNKILQYQLSFLTSEFPMLEDAMQLTVNELKDAIEEIDSSTTVKEDYDAVSSYLSPEEYQKLSECEKYQLALDRYLNKPNKSSWEIGISYERYIGYIYEMNNYKVRYNGALEGFNDLGRDIIAENNEEILIIQCKYWKKEKVIRENTIFQLCGTMILKQLDTSKKVKGILVTTTSLSDEARKIAKYLNIQIRENEIFNKKYPCIKCNINRVTNEKIYHLPFDQQYDKIQIEPRKGEKYVYTTKEAEDLRIQKSFKASLFGTIKRRTIMRKQLTTVQRNKRNRIIKRVIYCVLLAIIIPTGYIYCSNYINDFLDELNSMASDTSTTTKYSSERKNIIYVGDDTSTENIEDTKITENIISSNNKNTSSNIIENNMSDTSTNNTDENDDNNISDRFSSYEPTLSIENTNSSIASNSEQQNSDDTTSSSASEYLDTYNEQIAQYQEQSEELDAIKAKYDAKVSAVETWYNAEFDKYYDLMMEAKNKYEELGGYATQEDKTAALREKQNAILELYNNGLANSGYAASYTKSLEEKYELVCKRYTYSQQYDEYYEYIYITLPAKKTEKLSPVVQEYNEDLQNYKEKYGL